MPAPLTDQALYCYHCGDECVSVIRANDKIFCCEGCRMVFQVLNENELCGYYDLNKSPGASQKIAVRQNKFAFLDDEQIQDKLISFKDDKQVHVCFYLPQIHCSSCLYLLENLHRLQQGIVSCKVNFVRKEVVIVFLQGKTSLRKVAEILAGIGYEPYISLNDLKEKRPAFSKTMIYRLGVAGFCFGNIMLMSFPEYLGIDVTEMNIRSVFRWLNVLLAIPVFFYSAFPFYASSWKSLRQKFLNIDAPIALAIIITFTRSLYEVFSGTGGGYFDSMTGIVFFMLAGRVIQNKTYQQLSFERDYTSYFPVAVSIVKEDTENAVQLPDIKAGDTLRIHNEELIPADGILTKGKAFIDYSFVTGESMPVRKEMGELVYAGGKQTAGNIELLVIKEVTQSYLTGLWNRDALKKEKQERPSFVHVLSRWFTYIVFAIAIVTAFYWCLNDVASIWPAVTAVFIIACPCALLLSSTFTNGNILRIFGRNHFYLRHAQGIEDIAKVNHIVFDKTGTLTTAGEQEIVYEGKPLTALQKQQMVSVCACSTHPLSKALAHHFADIRKMEVSAFQSTPGEGIAGFVDNTFLKIGSAKFINAGDIKWADGTIVYVCFDGEVYGLFRFSNKYRADITAVVKQLKKHYKLSVVSGDNEAERENLCAIFGADIELLFNQKPEDKLHYIEQLQHQGECVMMIGDGLNDAGALKQSDIGIAMADNNNTFTPASDAILEAKSFSKLAAFAKLSRANRSIVMASFVLSIVYNVIGLYFAVQGNLSPVIAAILMPSSSLCILLLTFGSSNRIASRLKL
ncbi:MAG: heavy metal translocating P-type ATPase metal-binding domain-containing protein [Agriterribacter sp.]